MACGCCVRVCALSAIRIWNGITARVDADRCVGCGKCAEVCPAGAAALRKGKAHINSRICIRCFCCQEFCPKGAVSVHRPLLAWLLSR